MLSFLPPGAGVRATRQCGKGQKSWNGVAILGGGAAPIVTRTELPGDPADAQSRYIEAAVHVRVRRAATKGTRQY